MANYTETNPVPVGNSITKTLTNIDTASKIDVLRLLGKPATKILVTLKPSDVAGFTINSAVRRNVPFVSGTIDTAGKTSALPRTGYWDSSATPPARVPGADNRCNVDINIWGIGGMVQSISNGTGANIIWNSYEHYGDLPISNIEFGTITPNVGTVITVTFVA